MPSGSVIQYEGKRGVVWRIKYRDTDDKQVMETVGAERDGWTRKKADAELRERLVRVERKGYRRPTPITFGEYVDQWLTSCHARRAWKPRTYMANRGSIERLRPFFGSVPLAKIRRGDVTAYVQETLVDFAPATVNLDVNVLVDVFNSAIREELIETNPALLVERPRLPRKRWRVLSPSEVGPVARAFTSDLARAVFLTLVVTGLRRFELQALRWRNVDLVDCVLRVEDSKSEDGVRSIALSPKLAEELWQLRRRTPFQGDDERVFAHEGTGAAVSAKWFARELRAAMKAAGVAGPIRPFHDLRHTAITNDAAAGSSPIAVMTRAGHSDMKTTKKYLHLAGVVFRDEADALERRLLGVSADTALVGETPDRRAPGRIDNVDESSVPQPEKLGHEGAVVDLELTGEPRGRLMAKPEPLDDLVVVAGSEGHAVESSTRMSEPELTSHDQKGPR